MSKGFPIRFGTQIYKELLRGNFDVLHTFKYYSEWKNSLQPGRNSIVDEQPWITFPVITLLDQFATAETKVFEYGGGGSTLFFVNRVRELVTVEHDAEWFAILKKKIEAKGTSNWTGNLILPEKRNTVIKLNPDTPEDYYSSDQAFVGSTFKSYARFIDKFPDGYFDIVLVDGRARPSCAHHSIPKIKIGGYLVIDNSDRNYYFTKIDNSLKKQFKLVYNKKDLSPYVDFLTQTAIWRKIIGTSTKSY